VATAEGATFLQIDTTGLHVEKGGLTTTVEIVPQVKLTADEQAKGKIDSNKTIWDAYSTTVRTDNQTVISKSASELAIDRSTGAADPAWDGQWLDTTGGKDYNVHFTDQEYVFPFNTQKQDYKVFDNDTRSAFPARFTSVDNVGGIDTYHFVQQVPDTQLTLDATNLGLLQSTFTPKAGTAKLMYHDSREFWIAPATGQIVKLRDHPVQTFVGDDGTSVTLLDADFSSTAATNDAAVASAKNNAMQISIVTLYAPVGLGIVGLVLLIAGLLLMRRKREPISEGGAWDESLAPPRHRLRGDAEADTLA
jgi:hypothetical protein